jgi:RsiW-degrading membrane proteinase PrsW (M82 family)
MTFYLYYLYSKSKNKKDFLYSPYNQSVSIAIALFFISYFIINMFFNEPPQIQEVVIPPKSTEELILEDARLHQKAEENFTDPYVHQQYINHHFQIPKHIWNNDYGQNDDRDDYSIINFYRDRLSFADSLYVNNARLGLGLIYQQLDSIDRSSSYLKAIKVQPFPLVEATLAKIYLSKQDTLGAIQHFKNASKVNDSYQHESGEQLISLLSQTHRNGDLIILLHLDPYKKYFSPKLASKLYLLNNELFNYYSVLLFQRAFDGIKITGFIAALAILLVWAFYMVRLDFFEQEHKGILFIVLIIGMLFSLLCFFLYDTLEHRFDFYMRHENLLVYSVFGIGLVEESVKILPLILLLIVSPQIIDEPYDYILYAALSALGFSFMENLIYFDGDLQNVIHGRSLTSVPGHIIDSSIIAYGFVLARYRFSSKYALPIIILFFFLGILNHGLYDYWLFTHSPFLFLLSFLISVSIWILIINNCLNNSPSFSYLISSNSSTTQLILSLSLLGILILEYIMVAWENGPAFANETFNGNLMIGGLFITYYSNRLTNMDLVKGYWASIPFKTVNDQREGKVFDLRNFLWRFLSGDNYSHSFVNLQILFSAHPENEKLRMYFNLVGRGVIIDRRVVDCNSKSGERYQDPFWFVVQSNTSINIGGSTEEIILFRFEDTKPSFEATEVLPVYLFSFKGKVNLESEIKREDLRALGRGLIQKSEMRKDR